MTVKIVNGTLTRPASMKDVIGFYDIGFMPSKHEVAGSSPAGIATKYPNILGTLRLDYTLVVDLCTSKSPISFDLICGDLRAKRLGIRNGFVTNFHALTARAELALTQKSDAGAPLSQARSE